ncbi:hypothetical protein BS333_21045 (plasmid) [Vibrio azureus]|uniref:Uncharacterized protein n=1 Tax=Vibrio azureus NBRC 104587 TaxID=1219077 RepID=U3C163_9VIBR|nr:hypothetical protein [Vibrio azureus]AUI88863.1 hypothetical protein BS333_21045 [Vibrio azureus]GAD75244.1 hypothetical protein VAZ01S_023_00110 [Vibrio azureus NBRC 104587]
MEDKSINILWKFADTGVFLIIVAILSFGYLKYGFSLFDAIIGVCCYLVYRAYFIEVDKSVGVNKKARTYDDAPIKIRR